ATGAGAFFGGGVGDLDAPLNSTVCVNAMFFLSLSTNVSVKVAEAAPNFFIDVASKLKLICVSVGTGNKASSMDAVTPFALNVRLLIVER
ncbi:MAG TPA: hypothetical protein VFC15_08635, partial [Candidatus Limnocylindrales bacterium]|nr:hypothetical protein [Candidatus Limnocylindrales bacterium]